MAYHLDRRSIRQQRITYEVNEEQKILIAIERPGGVRYDTSVNPSSLPVASQPRAAPPTDIVAGPLVRPKKMASGVGWWYFQTGTSEITHPPTLVQNPIHNPAPGDLFVHEANKNRCLWLRDAQNSWQVLPPTAGTATGLTTDKADDVSQPTTSNRWLNFPVNKAPNWVTWETISRKRRARLAEDVGNVVQR